MNLKRGSFIMAASLLVTPVLAQGPWASIDMTVTIDGADLVVEVEDAGDDDAPAPEIEQKRIVLEGHMPGSPDWEPIGDAIVVDSPTFPETDAGIVPDPCSLEFEAYNSLRFRVELDVVNSKKVLYVSRSESFGCELDD